MTVTTRTAPRNARMIRPSADQLAAIDDMVARAAAFGSAVRFGSGGRLASIETSPDPEPAAPNTEPGTGARLDAQDAQLQDHETRIAALEDRSPPPSGLNDGEGAKPAEASGVVQPAAKIVDSRAIYGRMSASAATPPAPMPEMIQTSSGAAVLDAGAINARHNAIATARVGRPHARARG